MILRVLKTSALRVRATHLIGQSGQLRLRVRVGSDEHRVQVELHDVVADHNAHAVLREQCSHEHRAPINNTDVLVNVHVVDRLYCTCTVRVVYIS